MHQFHDACAYKFYTFSLPHSNNHSSTRRVFIAFFRHHQNYFDNVWTMHLIYELTNRRLTYHLCIAAPFKTRKRIISQLYRFAVPNK